MKLMSGTTVQMHVGGDGEAEEAVEKRGRAQDPNVISAFQLVGLSAPRELSSHLPFLHTCIKQRNRNVNVSKVTRLTLQIDPALTYGSPRWVLATSTGHDANKAGEGRSVDLGW